MASFERRWRSRKRWQALRRAVLERDGWRCVKCGKPGRLEVDHIVRVSDGGGFWDKSNLQALCRPCHFQKTRGENSKPLSPAQVAWLQLRDG